MTARVVGGSDFAWGAANATPTPTRIAAALIPMCFVRAFISHLLALRFARPVE
jgi:hypothetical protein